MFGASLAASYLYFLLTPLKGDSSELLGRVKPHVLDVLIAFFGGLAGIIAAVTKNKGSAMTIVPGVAIATALMPPLCTAGYGLAIHNWNYFFGALYLFLLNSVFICLSTYIVAVLLKFPKVTFLNPKTERKVNIYIIIATLLVIVPSVIAFVGVINETVFENSVVEYVDELKGLADKKEITLTEEHEFVDDQSYLTLTIAGGRLTAEEIDIWKELRKKHDLAGTEVKINQPPKEEVITEGDAGWEKYIEDQTSQLKTKDEELAFYKDELQKIQSIQVDLTSLDQRMQQQFPEIARYSYARAFESDFKNGIDTVYIFNVHWNDTVDTSFKKQTLPALSGMLQLELELALKRTDCQLRVVEY